MCQLADLREQSGAVGGRLLAVGDDRLHVAVPLRDAPQSVDIGGAGLLDGAARFAARLQHDAAEKILPARALGNMIDQQPEPPGGRRRGRRSASSSPRAIAAWSDNELRSRGASCDVVRLVVPSWPAGRQPYTFFTFQAARPASVGLLGVAHAVGGLFDRSEYELAEHVGQRIFAGRVGGGSDDDVRTPDANLPHQVCFELLRSAAVVDAIVALDDLLGRKLEALLPRWERPGRVGAACANSHQRGTASLRESSQPRWTGFQVESHQVLDDSQVAFVARETRE